MIRKHSLPFGRGSPAVGSVAVGTSELLVSLGCSCGDIVKGCGAGEARGVDAPSCRGSAPARAAELPGRDICLLQKGHSFASAETPPGFCSASL